MKPEPPATFYEAVVAWDTIPVVDGENLIIAFRKAAEKGAVILRDRDAAANKGLNCSNPKCLRPIPDGKWLNRMTVRDKATGIERIVTSCSERCYQILTGRTTESRMIRT